MCFYLNHLRRRCLRTNVFKVLVAGCVCVCLFGADRRSGCDFDCIGQNYICACFCILVCAAEELHYSAEFAGEQQSLHTILLCSLCDVDLTCAECMRSTRLRSQFNAVDECTEPFCNADLRVPVFTRSHNTVRIIYFILHNIDDAYAHTHAHTKATHRAQLYRLIHSIILFEHAHA